MTIRVIESGGPARGVESPGRPRVVHDRQGATGPAGGQILRTAAGVVSGHKVVRDLGDGRCRHADVTDLSDAEAILGVSKNAASDGGSVTIIGFGELDGPWSFAPDEPVFLGSDPGSLVQSPPSGAFVRQIGVAVRADRLFVQLRPTFVTP